MSRAATTLFVWSIYLGVLSLTVLLLPNVLLGLFGIPPTQEVWIRLVGMFLGFLAYFSLRAARTENAGYMLWSAQVRATVPLFFGAFVLLLQAPPALMLFSVVDVAAAVWTWTALRADAGARRPA